MTKKKQMKDKLVLPVGGGWWQYRVGDEEVKTIMHKMSYKDTLHIRGNRAHIS